MCGSIVDMEREGKPTARRSAADASRRNGDDQRQNHEGVENEQLKPIPCVHFFALAIPNLDISFPFGFRPTTSLIAPISFMTRFLRPARWCGLRIPLRRRDPRRKRSGRSAVDLPNDSGTSRVDISNQLR